MIGQERSSSSFSATGPQDVGAVGSAQPSNDLRGTMALISGGTLEPSASWEQLRFVVLLEQVVERLPRQVLHGRPLLDDERMGPGDLGGAA
jgi:hypothetical protein